MTFIGLISLLIAASFTIQQSTSSIAVGSETAILRTERKKDFIPNKSSVLEKKPSFLDAVNLKKTDRLKILAKLREKNRTKRWLSALIKALRYVRKILRSSKWTGKTRNGIRTTMHFTRRGSFRDAVYDFYKLRPYNVKRFSGNNGLFGLEGRVRKYGVEMIVKVRNRSREGSPTLEVIIGNKIQKYRYKQ